MKTQVMKKAWTIRRKAAHKYNCHVSEIHFGTCLSLAWKLMNKSLKQRILESGEVINYKEWERGALSRTYLTLKGQQRSYRGDNSCQVYFDNHSQELVVKYGKGRTSNSMDDSIEAIQAI